MKKLYCTKLDRPHDAQGAKDGPGMLAAETHTWTPDAQGAIDGSEPLTSKELLDCPFCGSAARYIDISDDDGFGIAVECSWGACGVSTMIRYPEKEDGRAQVREAWNRRARTTEPPSASREQQLLTELAYWKARCGVMHGDETNAVTKSVTVPVLPTSEEDERIVDAAIKRRLSGETEAPLTFETFFAKVRETGWNPSPRELATLLYEYEKEHCICSEFQGVNLRCPIHGTAESEEGSL